MVFEILLKVVVIVDVGARFLCSSQSQELLDHRIIIPIGILLASILPPLNLQTSSINQSAKVP